MNSPSILFISDNFPPEVNAPASRTYEHCREWVTAGAAVTVITCFPNFPAGKIYPGYRNRLWQVERLDGIRIIRVWSYVAPNEGTGKRVLDYLSFMLMAVIAATFVRRPGVVVATSPQFFAACAGYLASKLKRRPFVLELRDLWPESIEAVGAMRPGRALRILSRIEQFLYQKAAAIVSVTNSFKEVLVARGIAAEKIFVITNGVDLSRFQPVERDRALQMSLSLHGKFVVGYIGTHGLAHALHTLLEAAAALAARGQDNIAFLLVGGGADKAALVKSGSALGLTNVRFCDPVPKEDIPRYLSLLDMAIIHLRKQDLFKSVIPSKIFETMAMGVPILHGVEGESAAIVKEAGAGFCFEPENAEQLADLIAQFAREPAKLEVARRRGVEAAGSYDRGRLAREMLTTLRAVVQSG